MDDIGVNLRVRIESFDYCDEGVLIYVGGKVFVDRGDADFFAVTNFRAHIAV